MGTRVIFQRSLLILLLGLSVNSPAATSNNEDERWYEIEIIIFENLDQAGMSTESWPKNPGMPNFENVIELMPAEVSTLEDNNINLDKIFSSEPVIPVDPAITEEPAIAESPLPEPYQLLANNELNLTSQEIKLSTSEKYYPLLHIAWRQPVLSRENAKAVHIYSNMEQSQTDVIQSSPETLAIPPMNEFFMYQESPDSELPLNVIDGTIKITRGKYLHMETDILYRIQPEGNNEFNIFGFRKEDQALTVFRMQDSRRMRSGELHYFDHPLIGMIAIITPYQLPEQQIDETETIPLDEPTTDGEQDPDNNDQLDQGSNGFQ